MGLRDEPNSVRKTHRGRSTPAELSRSTGEAETRSPDQAAAINDTPVLVSREGNAGRSTKTGPACKAPPSYGPFQLPDWPPPFLATFGAATNQPIPSLPHSPKPPSLHAVLHTPVDRIRCSLVGELRGPARVSSLSVLPSPLSGRVGVHITTFEACSSFTRVTACRVAHPPFLARAD
jgi:hypothetical protein